jgi:hypothetical protein
VHWAGDDGWVSDAEDADSVKLSAIIGAAASLTIRVENQTQYAPPGSRQTGGTAAAPLGGTASNLNDNDDDTVTTTSALGDLSGQAVADRIIAKLTLAEATDLICVEARGILGSAASSSNAMGLYYSDDDGATWSQAGTGFTLSTSAQNIQRTGTFSGVTDIAVVTEAKNWSTDTNTVAGLNAFDDSVTATVGQSWIIGEGAIGDLAGNEGKVARCEATDTLTIYTPEDGDEVYDKDTKTRIRWSSVATAWQAAASGYSSVEYFEDPDAESLSSTGSNGSDLGTDFPATAPTQTLNKSKILETLTATVQADRAEQVIEVIFDAALASGPSASGPIDSVTSVLILGAIFVDDETDARDWRQIHRFNQSTGTISASSLSSMSPQCSFKLTLSDTSSHTLKMMFQIRVNTAQNISSFTLPLARRSFTVRKLAG